jgi:hypothetical protein
MSLVGLRNRVTGSKLNYGSGEFTFSFDFVVRPTYHLVGRLKHGCVGQTFVVNLLVSY